VTPAEVDEVSGAEFGASISRERLDVVDGDVLVWLAEDAGFDTDPLYQQLNVVPEGRDIFLAPENPLYDALNFSTILSLNYALDGMVPLLAAAVDGDPETVATP
jgi:iron complex transport system substrate-binding protein